MQSERALWSSVPGEWRQLYGGFREQGVSLEWHDFECDSPVDWSSSFHSESLEICINRSGCGLLETGSHSQSLEAQTVIHYRSGNLSASRLVGQRHQFLTVELSREWLARHTQGLEGNLSPVARGFLKDKRSSLVAQPQPLARTTSETLSQLLNPPASAPARALWYHGKVFEILSQTLVAEAPAEMFCTRQKRVARERVMAVRQVLAERLEEPPTLVELGKTVGCSPFYLCRVFSQETGLTISQFTRQIRMEKAAELLRAGAHNVTEAAMAVGYSSLSHFSKAFSETFGECPCLYSQKGR